jgi:hypothetical protein
MSDRTEFKCELCKKHYSSYKSRWLHIKKYHTNDVNPLSTQCQPKVNPNLTEIKKSIKCDECKMKFTTRQAKSRHMKNSCKKNKDDNISILKNEINELKIQLKEIKEKLKTMGYIYTKNNMS